MIKKDTLNKCFICNIDREEFDRVGENFSIHFQQEHYMYNYLYFMMVVKKKTPSERNNIDDWVVENLEKKTIEHIPIKRCLMLSQSDADNIDMPKLYKRIVQDYTNIKDVFEFLNNNILKLEKSYKSFEGKIDNIQQRMDI